MKVKDWLKEETFTLSLSSGFFGFFAHTGFLSALEEENILPKKITGSSAGALIGGMWASGCSTITIKELLFSIKREDFFDPIGFGGYLRGDKYKKLLYDLMPINRIEDCRVELSLSAYNILKRETKIFNSGDLLDAIYASTAVPFMFQPLYTKKGIFFDGGIEDRSSLKSTLVGERIFYHHLKSHSLWRRKNSKSLKIPKQDNLITLVIENLPRVTPYKLSKGKDAFYIAKERTKEFLEKSLI